MKVKLTAADLEALRNVYNRAEDDWLTYSSSGFGPEDFGGTTEWRSHARQVNADLQRIRRLLNRASAAGTRAQSVNPVWKGTAQ